MNIIAYLRDNKMVRILTPIYWGYCASLTATAYMSIVFILFSEQLWKVSISISILQRRVTKTEEMIG